MPVWAIALVCVAGGILILLLTGGALAIGRRNRTGGARLLSSLAEADEALARARAEDRGWDRDAIDEAARAAHHRRRPEARIEAIQLLQVVDRPGTEDDEARLRIVDETGAHELLLGRRSGAWAEVA
jgi:hypothetical protein